MRTYVLFSDFKCDGTAFRRGQRAKGMRKLIYKLFYYLKSFDVSMASIELQSKKAFFKAGSFEVNS